MRDQESEERQGDDEEEVRKPRSSPPKSVEPGDQCRPQRRGSPFHGNRLLQPVIDAGKHHDQNDAEYDDRRPPDVGRSDGYDGQRGTHKRIPSDILTSADKPTGEYEVENQSRRS